MSADSKRKASGISRREFAIGAAATAAVLIADSLPAQQSTSPATVPASQEPRSPQEKPRLSPEAQAEVDAKIAAILRQHGNGLTKEQKADIRRLVTEAQPSLEKIRAFPLENSNAPATVLKLFP